MASLVFLSYASADHDRAQVICQDLEADGISCWMASRDILGSEDYVKVIPQAITESRLLLIVLSESSLASPHVYREVHLATDEKKPILPVRVDPIRSVEGQLKYSLAGIQWVDATPRVETALPQIRSELRRLLGPHDVVVKSVRRSPFERVLASAFAWSLVVLLTVLTISTVRIYWVNLVPWSDILLEVTRHPLPLVAVLAWPFLAIGTQFFLHRRLTAIPTLDALFAIAPKAALARTSVATASAAILAAVLVAAPRTIQISKVPTSSTPEQDTSLARIGACTDPTYEVSGEHYEVSVRVGRLNPARQYVLRINLVQSDPDSVNFCDIWASSRLTEGVPIQVASKMDDTLPPYRVRFIELRRPRDAFGDLTRVAFTLIHPRLSPPRYSVEGTATIEGEGDGKIQSIPLPILASDWRK